EFFNHSKHMIIDEYLEMTEVQHIKPAISDNFFGSFKELEFDAACKRTIIIPFHMLPYLKNLEELNVHSSDAVKVIFDIDESEDKTKVIVSSLKKLTLNNLPNLKHVWKESSTGIISFHNLQEVVVNDCGSLITLFSSSLARNLGKLKKLEITDCGKLVEIAEKEDGMEHGTKIMFELPCLSQLLLGNMPLLSCFYPGKHDLDCPLLESLLVGYCPKLKLFTSDFDENQKGAIEAQISPLQQPMFSVEKVSPNIKLLALNEENIMLFREVELLQEILCNIVFLWLCFEDDKKEKDSLPFDFFHKLPNLFSLMIQKCFGLKEIFPSQKLQVHDRGLAGLKELFLINLGELELVGLEHPWEFIEYSKRIILEDYLGMSEVHHKQPIVSDKFFGSFKKLEFDAACNRAILIPSHVLPYLKNLEELNVKESDAMQIIFDIDESEVKTKGVVFCLKKITLKNLSNLKHVWKENSSGIVSFHNLQEVDVDGCGSLVTLFSLSLAKNLGKLETLDIQKCEKMVEIVGREDDMEHGTTIEFPCLRYLNLEKMPLLSCFYPGKHDLECPLLVRLYVECCPKLKVFRSSFDDDSKKEEVLEAPTNLLQQPLFPIDKVSPQPVGLTLSEENIKLMSDARLPQDLLCKLEVLILSFEDDNNEKDSLPFDFFHKLPNLKSLRVQKCCGLKEIFPSQKLQVHDKVLSGLKRLFLFELSELECIGLEHTWVQPYSKKLELLKLRTCPRVESIVSCAVSFINLKEVYVKLCEKMEYLFTCTTLKSLVKLETLSIKKCESIKEIVKKDDEDGCDEIVFGRLRSIK
ncbi:hypothetical protein V8G54_021580, partial [Vigna mungo]